ncbi:MAG: response regulator transcription factor [Planctomycetota bacterium]
MSTGDDRPVRSPNRRTVLTIEDSAPVRRGIVDSLRHAGYHTIEASNGREGLGLALRGTVDLVLLDVMLPERDGFAVLKELRRAQPTLPVIMLTARGSEDERVRGLAGGADDYVVKPFSSKELIARVEAVLRRSAARPLALDGVDVAGRRVDFERSEVHHADGSVVRLTEKECALLQYLARNPGRTISREELLRTVWGLDPRGVRTRTVDMHVARLRDHLRDHAERPEVLVTVRGRGYMLAGRGEDA